MTSELGPLSSLGGSATALAGLRVIDCTENLAGPYCSMLLGDLGADVIKVERPGSGDSQRGHGPHVNGAGLPFAMVNRNKRSLTANLKHPEGAAVIRRLAAGADVFLENYRPGTMAAAGLDYASVAADNPAIVYASISGFGGTGPYRERGGFDLIAQAMSGLMSVTGEPGREPVKAGFPVTDLGAGMFCAVGILAALAHRTRSGRGQQVDTSLFETGLAWSVWQAAAYLGTGETPGPLGSAHPLSAPYQAFHTSDGQIIIGAGSQSLFRRLCDVLELASLADDPRFRTQPDRMRHRQALADMLEATLRRRSREEWLALLTAAGIPCGPINDIPAALADPQTVAREMVIAYDHPVIGRSEVIGNPLKLSETPWRFQRPAPALGEHTDEVLKDAGYTAAAIAALRSSGAI